MQGNFYNMQLSIRICWSAPKSCVVRYPAVREKQPWRPVEHGQQAPDSEPLKEIQFKAGTDSLFQTGLISVMRWMMTAFTLIV